MHLPGPVHTPVYAFYYRQLHNGCSPHAMMPPGEWPQYISCLHALLIESVPYHTPEQKQAPRLPFWTALPAAGHMLPGMSCSGLKMPSPQYQLTESGAWMMAAAAGAAAATATGGEVSSVINTNTNPNYNGWPDGVLLLENALKKLCGCLSQSFMLTVRPQSKIA